MRSARGGVLALDGVDDLALVTADLLGRRVEAGEEGRVGIDRAADAVEEQQQHAVLRGRGELDVEVEVVAEQRHRVEVGRVVARGELAQAIERLGRAAQRGQPAALLAEGHAELEHLAEQRHVGRLAAAQEQVRDQLDPRGAHEVGDAGAVALPRAHEADELERLDGLAQGAAVHAEALGQLALGGACRPRRRRRSKMSSRSWLTISCATRGRPTGRSMISAILARG